PALSLGQQVRTVSVMSPTNGYSQGVPLPRCKIRTRPQQFLENSDHIARNLLAAGGSGKAAGRDMADGEHLGNDPNFPASRYAQPQVVIFADREGFVEQADVEQALAPNDHRWSIDVAGFEESFEHPAAGWCADPRETGSGRASVTTGKTVGVNHSLA